jgi:hypothetical protein
MISPEDLRATYKMLFNTNDGQVVLDDLQRRFHIRTIVHAERCCETAFRDGQRSVVLMLQSLLEDRPPPIEETDDYG